MNETRLKSMIGGIKPFDDSFFSSAFKRWQTLAKPLGGLGVLEDDVCRIARAQQTISPSIEKRALAVFCSDNGIVAEGVSQTDSSVTAVVARNLCLGETSVCKMARRANCDVFPVDVGINVPIDDERICDMHGRRGTASFLREDAMSREECCGAILSGIDFASALCKKGYDILATGEMGIGNTTTASAVLSALLGEEPENLTGKGAGLSDEGLLHKIAVIKEGLLQRKPDRNDVLDVLCKVGGFDICAMAGFFIGGAMCRVPVIVDGFISAVAALCAKSLCPKSQSVMLASHVSAERAGKVVLAELGLKPVVTAEMHLGEGTGCMALLPLLDMAFDVFYGMPTFDDIKIEAYKPL